MNSLLEKTWSSVLLPMLQRPRRQQVAALCYREKRGQREFLLITSRNTKRWIIPKGWPIRGLMSHEAALQEAWEEAGVKTGNANARPAGTFTYQKTQTTGWSFPVQTLVYSVAVTELSTEYPEAAERSRKWVSANDAAEMVEEPGLQQIFYAIAA